MNFGLLQPWLLLGAIAVAVPIWLHLRRKEEPNLVRFSALRFLDDSPQARSRPLHLRDLVLLALRLSALLLVAAAFAWPYRREPERAIVRESRVYILDNTLSQQANGGFGRDRTRILDELDRLGAEIQVAAIELTALPRVAVGFGDDREVARQRLRDLTPSHQRGSYLAAFRQAHNLLANSLGQQRRIVFYGDHQANQWTEEVNSPPFLERVRLDVAPPPATNAPTLALAEPQLQRVFLGDKAVVHFTAKLTHSGGVTRGQITLRANDQLILNRPVDLAGQPETIVLQAQWEVDPGLWLRGEAGIEGAPDALARDNRVFFVLPPVRVGRVALLARSPYLRLALSPEVMRGYWATRAIEPAQLGEELGRTTDEDVLVVESNYLQSHEARQLVGRYLEQGRGVFLLLDRVAPAIHGALRELGFALPAAPDPTPPAPARLQYFFSNHPVFHPFSSPDYGSLLEVEVRPTSRLDALEGMPLLFSESGDGLFFQGTKFPGRLFVAAFGLDREQTSWPTHLTFIPFLDLCLQNLRPEDATPLEFEPGATAVLSLPAEPPVREVVLRDGTQELRRHPVDQGQAQIRLPDRPGWYALTYDTGIVPERFVAVNPSPKESQLTYLTAPDALRLWQIERPNAAAPAPAALPARLSLAAIWQQRLWWWLLVAGLGALAIETLWTSLRRHSV